MTRSCNRGYFDDCNRIGYIFLKQNKNTSKAIESFTKACDGGVMASFAGLGMLYGDGIWVDKDVSKAKNLFAKACDSGHMGACSFLAVLYGKSGNNEKALSLLNKSCDGGWDPGCKMLKKIKK